MSHLIFNLTESFIISNFKIDASSRRHHAGHTVLIRFVMDGILKSVIWKKRELPLPKRKKGVIEKKKGVAPKNLSEGSTPDPLRLSPPHFLAACAAIALQAFDMALKKKGKGLREGGPKEQFSLRPQGLKGLII